MFASFEIHKDVALPSKQFESGYELEDPDASGVNKDESILNHLYIAPEVIDNYVDNFDFPADVYSFAFFLYRMFSDVNLTKRFIPRTHFEERPKRQENIPDNYWHLIEQCWSNNTYDRPTFDEITMFLKNNDFTLEEFEMKTDLNGLSEYQRRIESDQEAEG